MSAQPKILITGATGYVGSRLATYFANQKTPIRLMARRPQHLKFSENDFLQKVQGDVFDPSSLDQALQGIETAYYLIHSMAMDDFEEKDREGAKNFAKACVRQGVKRVIYLGGLGEDQNLLSQHLRSRHEVGDILRAHPLCVIEFRASIVIGSGSISFELIRSLIERLPVLITPKWVRVVAQPISIEDLIQYLAECVSKNFLQNHIYEIGGEDQKSYGDIMQDYAQIRNLKRRMIAVPFLTPKLSSLWLGLVTPIYARIGQKLMTSLQYPTIVKNKQALQDFSIRPMSTHKAILRAIAEEDQIYGDTRWDFAMSSVGVKSNYGGVNFGLRLVDHQSQICGVTPQKLFQIVQEIGGERGWYYAQFLWKLRGAMDLLLGGVGMRRGRVDPHYVRVGEPLDFWRVEEFIPGQRLRLKAEMKVPGRAWLQFDVSSHARGSKIEQTAIFDPQGLWGRIYWYALYPIHKLIFKGMLKNIVKKAQKLEFVV